MRESLDMATLAALVGDPARARMLTALMGGTALTATELAVEAGISASTASAHLARLAAAEVLALERQGRHRYYRLFDVEIAEMLELLTGVAARRGPQRRPGPTDPQLRAARVCYDHLAGERGVWLADQLRRAGILGEREGWNPDGARAVLTPIGVDVAAIARARRVACRLCLDWSERRHHLGGGLGAAILDRILALRWARRTQGSRAVLFSDAGERAFVRAFTAAPGSERADRPSAAGLGPPRDVAR